MKMAVIFQSEAQTEFEEARDWYRRERVILGREFVAAVRHVLNEISKHPTRFPIALGDVRHISVSRFPYCVYYFIDQKTVVIVAVIHTSRDPSVWQKRI